ncbi:general transcription factor 3C polypeptide 6 isoform X2 [Aquila chrysaetos chrysaetos]|uniref:general transcription factor 3C polypeptide 6 isoform X2 n=1 Tax=Aquila chrysaetos chrysaetos TaxID=223781 RepID=UPI001176FA99|nr:general transcription factor 3C polypeptide 6 isoform X2 [Aquila chrysaetos chrysaetos]
MAAAESTEEGERKDEAEEDEVEEQLVMVELSGIIDSDFLEKCENKCKILGIETERPILQVDRYVFAGEYEDTLGTCVVFEENTEHDAEGNQKVQLKYKCHTMKKLNMTRTLLTEKKEGEENVGGVEWLQIKDRDFSYSRPNTICSFLREKEDSEESAQAQDKLTEESEGEVFMSEILYPCISGSQTDPLGSVRGARLHLLTAEPPAREPDGQGGLPMDSPHGHRSCC